MNSRQLPGNHFPDTKGSEDSSRLNEGDTEIRRGEMDGTKPFTNRDSKMVMLRGERGDIVEIDEIITVIEDKPRLPNHLELQQRTSTYYGTEFLCEDGDPDHNRKYLLTAPGPDAYLYLWGSDTDSDGFREKWYTIAEVKASFTDGLPKYPICSSCGNPISSLEHERLSAINQCSSPEN